MARFHRRGQKEPSGSVAALVILLTLLGMIIFYVMTVPESQRELLNITAPPHVLLDVKPGLVSAVEDVGVTKFEHSLMTVTADNSPQPQSKLLQAQLMIRRSLLSQDVASLNFELSNKSILAWARIEAYVVERSGTGNLLIYLNGRQVYSASPAPNSKISVTLPPDLLVEGKNNLSIAASSVGWRFWQTNSYQLSDIDLVTGEYDSPTAKVSQIATLSKEEVTGLTRAQLTTYVKQLGELVNLKLYVNGEEIFDGIPPSTLTVDIPTSLLNAGTNLIEWEAGRDGIYQITFTKLQITTSEFPIAAKEYDFTISSDWAAAIDAGTVTCKLYLSRDEARSYGDSITIRLNTHISRHTFTNEALEIDVCDYLNEGSNSISLTADKDIYITQLKAYLRA